MARTVDDKWRVLHLLSWLLIIINKLVDKNLEIVDDVTLHEAKISDEVR